LVLKYAGTKDEIKRAEEYTQFILDQRDGNVHCDLTMSRPDLTVVDIPEDVVGTVLYFLKLP
jgi:hypothetical protein